MLTLMNRLFKTKSVLMQEEIDFLRAQVAQLQNYILATGGVATVPFPTFGEAPTEERPVRRKLYTSETEEDVEYALQEGLIDLPRAEELLRAADALNADIEIA